ncbi:hypothetical protein ACP275_06G097400 [Erythranthe tilingii]
MSLITEKSPQDCAKKQELISERFIKRLFFCMSTIFLVLISVTLLVWLIIRPTKPRFSIKEAQINQLKIATPSSLNSSIHITLASINPNDKLGIHYDEFVVYASYNGERISPEASVTPFYVDHGETKPLSALLVGNHQPVGPFLAYQLEQDQEIGKMEMEFNAVGKLRWRVGNWVSKRTRFTVDCLMVVRFGSMNSPPLSTSTQGTVCSFSY